MKLWPFSKKNDMDGILDRTMELPPGVVLAAPDEPVSSTPLSIHAPSPVTEGPLTDPAASSEAEPAVQSQAATDDVVVKDPFVPSQSPIATLPAELPDALFSDSTAALWASKPIEAESIAPLSTESSNLTPNLESMESPASLASEPSPLASDNLTPPEPLMGTLWSPSPEPVVPTLSSISAAKAAAESAALPTADTLIESTSVESALVEPSSSDLLNNADLLAPPPLASESVSDSFALPELEASSLSLPESLEDQFNNLESFNSVTLPAEPGFDPDPLPSEEQVASLETPESALIVGDVAPFLPPESEPEERFESVSIGESLEEQQTASEILAELMAGSAKTSQSDGSDEMSGMSSEPLQAGDGFSDGFEVDLTAGFSSENDSFFADVPLEAMDGFAQPDEESQPGMFTLEEESHADVLDNLFQPSDVAAGAEMSVNWASELGQPDMAVQEAPDAFQSSFETEGAFDEPSKAEDAVNSLDETQELDAPDEIFAFEESDNIVVGSDLDSYDLGHYDDPDSPIEAFDLGNGGDLEPVLSLDMETDSPSEEIESSLVWAQSDDELAMPPVAASIEELFDEPMDLPEVAASQSVFVAHEALPALAETSGESVQSEAPKIPPVQAEHPKAMPVQPAAQSVIPLQESPFKASSSTNRIYSDSLADALESFEQEVLLRDTRFLKQSINNLVDRYFAQNKPENEW